LSDVLLDDERIVSLDEREFLADLLRHSKNNQNQSTPEVTRAIARIAGEIVVQRAGSLVGDSILRRLAEQNPASYSKTRTESLPPRPPGLMPPSPGPGPGMHRTFGATTAVGSLPPRPPGPVPPSPAPGPGPAMRP